MIKQTSHTCTIVEAVEPSELTNERARHQAAGMTYTQAGDCAVYDLLVKRIAKLERALAKKGSRK